MRQELVVSRDELRKIHKKHPNAKNAWVYNIDGGHKWEYHFDDFFEIVDATNKYDAQIKGWIVVQEKLANRRRINAAK